MSLFIFRDLEPSKTCMIKINLVLKFKKYGKNLRHNLYVYFSKYAKPQKVLVLSNECFVEVLLKFIFPILMFFFYHIKETH